MLHNLKRYDTIYYETIDKKNNTIYTNIASLKQCNMI